MKEEHITLLSNTFLFKGMERDACVELLRSLPSELFTFSKGDVIYSPSEFKRRIGFVAEGECLISRLSSSGHNVPLNTAKVGDSFGITSVFSASDEFPTVITAKTFCSIIFIDSEILIQLIKEKWIISLNVINFLTERIEFLNERIAAFSGMSVEEKLISHILSLHKRYGSLEFGFNKKRSAEAISCGRASLYRAMDTLSSEGFVKFDNKKIYILDLKGLERMSK